MQDQTDSSGEFVSGVSRYKPVRYVNGVSSESSLEFIKPVTLSSSVVVTNLIKINGGAI